VKHYPGKTIGKTSAASSVNSLPPGLTGWYSNLPGWKLHLGAASISKSNLKSQTINSTMTFHLQKKITDHQWTIQFVQDEMMVNRRLLNEERKKANPDTKEIQRLEYELELFEKGIDQYQASIKKLQQDAQISQD
jgi:hypothetical protein